MTREELQSLALSLSGLGVFAGLFSLVSLIFFMIYNEKSVIECIEANRKSEGEQ